MRGGHRPGSGRKKMPIDIKGQEIYCYLPGWVVQWLEKQTEPISSLVERALIRTFKIKKGEK